MQANGMASAAPSVNSFADYHIRMLETWRRGSPMPVEPWSRADVFFLQDALRRGLSVEGVALFLGRTPEEVRAKERELDKSNE
jgi:hypothetical protein